ncbi:NAD-dependent deacetylase [Kitasatospora sp. MMS16-BH015]|uniref:SIR2 family NAD-dependent protein deacylase n=1 Tax=Kitasatospora sp. MMS16-BH015 TaxID=2018025 RepID=UPI000CA152A4|nr:Sir2 family NAD-dependent protein deacetylase [Kitasatospora sp. MMS16-BH015]AUG77790.1 NAD-dependent deacetylase [Kitasatospora sp. MMS16-BH015]
MSRDAAPRRPLIAALTGAGISTDSGIPDYRGPNGLWRREPGAEKLVTYQYYVADPEIRRRSWLLRQEAETLTAEPNAGHRALVELERAGVPLRVLTQNVDGLHQRAGLPDRKVFELHGTAQEVDCLDCAARTPMAEALARVAAGEPDPACLACGGVLKPATVMFGELLDTELLAKAESVAQASQLFLAIGSTLQVYPVAGLVRLAAEAGARLVIVNAEETPYDHLAEEVIREPISTALPALVGRVLAGEFG